MFTCTPKWNIGKNQKNNLTTVGAFIPINMSLWKFNYWMKCVLLLDAGWRHVTFHTDILPVGPEDHTDSKQLLAAVNQKDKSTSEEMDHTAAQNILCCLMLIPNKRNLLCFDSNWTKAITPPSVTDCFKPASKQPSVCVVRKMKQ